jgi:hypothetical protein
VKDNVEGPIIQSKKTRANDLIPFCVTLLGAGCRYGISTRVLPRLLIMDIEKEYYLPVPVDIKVVCYVCVSGASALQVSVVCACAH